MLKAMHLIHVDPPGRTHRYDKLFYALPGKLRSLLVKAAVERNGGQQFADYSDMRKLLSAFSRNYVSGRYPYERFEDSSPEEVAERGREWLARGAPEEDADFVYYPEELFGLTYALDRHLQAWLGSNSS